MLNIKKTIFALACLMAAVAVHAANWLGGMTEPENQRKISGKVYYVVTTASELAWIANEVNSGNNTLNVVLENDIVFYEGQVSESNHANIWTPMGTADYPFKGIFDGASHSIVGLYSNLDQAGFIEVLDTVGVVKNLSVDDGLFKGNSDAASVVVINYGLITLCVNKSIVFNTTYMGGICSKNYGKISNSQNMGKLYTTDANKGFWAGGIAAFNFGTINNSVNADSLRINNRMDYHNSYRFGGIAGQNSGSIQFVDNKGHVYMDDQSNGSVFYAGGVVGVNTGLVERTSNYGSVFVAGSSVFVAGSSHLRAGGIVGENDSAGLVKLSSNYGAINTGRQDRIAGGVVGTNNGAVENVFASFSSLSGDVIGAVVGTNGTNGSIVNSFYNQDLLSANDVGSNQGTVSGVGGYAAADMKKDKFAWMLNTTNGLTENTNVWTRKDDRNDGFPVFVYDCEDCKPIYKVVFDDEGVKTIRFTNYTGKVTLPSDPEPAEGMTFVAWIDNGRRAVKSSTIFTEDVTVNASYKSAGTLTNVLTFLDADDQELFTYVTDEIGKLASFPEAPAPAEGYYFKGWFDEEFNRVNETTVFKTNTTLKALYGELSDVSYTVTFKNIDGTVLQTKTVKHGTTPEYTAATPTLDATAQYTYTFAAWDAAIVPATADVVYTATYNAVINNYTISFVDFDDSEIWSTTQQYGSAVVFGGTIPTRETTVAYSYKFKSWNKTVGDVIESTTYKAVYDSTAVTYEVVFKNGSTVLSTQYVEYGKAASAPETPTRNGYLFSGWDRSFSKVTTKLVVNALFDLAPTHQLIIYVDGEVVVETAPAEGSEYTLPEAADKSGHTFLGWYDANGNKLGDAGDKITIVDDITITAKYEVNKYTITFMFGSTKLQSSEVEYNKVPTYDGVEPSREKTTAYTYTFVGWSPVVSAVTKSQTYNAVFDSTLNKYTIVFKSAEGVLQTKSAGYGSVPVYTGEEPAKDPTAQYEFTFAGWDPEVTSVVGAKTYTAIFDSTLRSYKVTFKVEGETVQSKSVFYGSIPSYVGDEPTKAKSENYTYEFAGWSPEIKAVTGTQTYIAVFDSTKIAKPASSSSDPSSSSSSVKGGSSSSSKGNSSSSGKDALNIVQSAPQFSIAVAGRALQVSGAKNGSVYGLMDMQGRLLQQGVASSNFAIEVPYAGAYLLRIGGSMRKVNVR